MVDVVVVTELFSEQEVAVLRCEYGLDVDKGFLLSHPDLILSLHHPAIWLNPMVAQLQVPV